MGENSPSHKRVISIEEEVHGKHTIHNHDHRRKKGYGAYARKINGGTIAAAILTILVLAGITVLILWLVYKPHKPKFTLIEAAVLRSPVNNTDSAMAPPYLLLTSMQFTLVTTNSNKRVSTYYDHLSAFVTYRNQIITNPEPLPPLYHHKHTTVQIAPILGGHEAVPVSQEVINGLAVDETMGAVNMRLNLLGRLRWKAGAIKTSHYHAYIHCDFLVHLNKGFVGQVPFLTAPLCKVEV